jgi:prepilin-type N-terminal cleavage/methylation domain-containing protein
MRTSRPRGFMILELLIVIVVIGILASMAVSRFIETKDNGMVAAAQYDLDCLRKFLAYYSTDHGGFPPAAATYEDLKSQMVDLQGNPYGRLPLSNTYEWMTYALDDAGNYIVRIQVADHRHTVLVATPEGIHRE